MNKQEFMNLWGNKMQTHKKTVAERLSKAEDEAIGEGENTLNAIFTYLRASDAIIMAENLKFIFEVLYETFPDE